MISNRKIRFIDLFAGIGGFHHAALKVFPNAECVMAVEWDKSCQKIYSTMFPFTPLRGDIREILSIGQGAKKRQATAEEIRNKDLIPDHDVLFAGFPCQPFSKGGAQKGMSEQTQGTLFHEILRIIEARRPQLILLENVAHLIGHDEGRTWSTIVNSLRSANYSVDENPLIVSPHQIKKSRGGAPQNRPRVYIIAVDTQKGLVAPKNSQLLRESDFRAASSSQWSIQSIFRNHHQNETKLDPNEARWLEAWDDFVKVIPGDSLPAFPIWVDAWYGRMRKPSRVEGSLSTLEALRRSKQPVQLSAFPTDSDDAPAWWKNFCEKNRQFYKMHSLVLDRWVKKWNVNEFPDSRRKFEWQARQWHPLRKGRTIRDCLIQFRPSGIRVKPPTYAPALVAMAQTPIIGLGHTWRKIGPAEAGRLQGYTDFRPWRKAMRSSPNFRVTAAYRQFGNAVSVGVAALILSRALMQIGKED